MAWDKQFNGPQVGYGQVHQNRYDARQDPPSSHARSQAPMPERTTENRKALGQGGGGMRDRLLSKFTNKVANFNQAHLSPERAARVNQSLGNRLQPMYPYQFDGGRNLPLSMGGRSPETYQQQSMHSGPYAAPYRPHEYHQLACHSPGYGGRYHQQHEYLAYGVVGTGVATAAAAHEVQEHAPHFFGHGPNFGGGGSINSGIGYGQIGQSLNGNGSGSGSGVSDLGGDGGGGGGGGGSEAVGSVFGTIFQALGSVLG